MIPWAAQFDFITARVLFGRNELTLDWQLGEPLPPTLIDDIVKALEGRAVSESSAATATDASAATTPVGRRTLAAVPETVPELPGALLVRSELLAAIKTEILNEGGSSTAALTSKKAKHKSAVHGMGGVGEIDFVGF